MAWVEAGGGSVSPKLTVQQAADSGQLGFELITRSGIEPGERLVLLPPQLQLRATDEELDPATKQVCQRHIPRELWGGRLAVHLLQHRLRGASSPFAPYIEHLPRGFPGVPLFFSQEGIAAVQYPPVLQQIKKRCRWLVQFAGAWEPISGVDVNALGWGLAAVTSRAFRIRSSGNATDPPAALLPLIDMANHSFDAANAEVKAVGGGAVAMVATQHVPPGAALLLNYGPLSNDFLFLDYGFVVPNNPHDTIALRWDLGLVEGAALIAGGPQPDLQLGIQGQPWKASYLTRMGLEAGPPPNPPPNLEVTLGPGGPDARLMGALRVLAASQRTPGSMDDVFLRPLPHAAEEATALRLALGMTLSSLAAFPTTLAEDQAVLAGQQPSRDMHGGVAEALAFRMAKKRLLATAAQRLGSQVKALEVGQQHSAADAREKSKGFGGPAVVGKGRGKTK